MNKKIGVILANLGTPDAPTPQAIKPYLRQFLSDPRVVDLPKWRWLPLLDFIILPKRSKHIAKTYQSIWTKQGSPLLAISKQQQQALQNYFNHQNQNVMVELGMTYGNPSMQTAVQKLTDLQVEKIIVLPLYPQYSSTTTAPVFDAFANALKAQRNIVPFEFIHSYHLDQRYINALVNSIKTKMRDDEFLLFSYHGIPVRYENLGDYYREHCRQTTLAVVDKLGLLETQWTMTFQSRFGKQEWLQPYTDKFMQKAAPKGIEKLAVICPGFSTDCLETLEEIDEENRAYFLQNGGKSYQYIPALNATQEHIEMMAKLVIDKVN
ncbi:ferrochelatase [Lonepinella koalarum]|uniref:Ferrochelatase n=1 Tax=Lonepinella koalarum TaxID=53417 RepID=A0A4R1L2K4_9PAST|nr:ferrochelatase [Lonepinella koalarum]MDH2926954.1 ferrochelatase [Lonepinella koalarum]TCK70389.1 ferrochelatase [Lonepinella koalarum]TFJ89228.1 ferrochelatase [Lonepinella koalarum]TYG33670.1 ferrochelatase [Lonepinella koalarum]